MNRNGAANSSSMTIGQLAARAGIGVETVRYYQRRRLLSIPARMGVRRYTADVLARVQFIRRSQALGFSLEEVRELPRLEAGGTRAQVRRIAGARLAGVRAKLAALHAMEHVLSHRLTIQ